MERILREKGTSALFLGKCLACSCLLTGISLLLLALLLYRVGLSEGVVSAAMAAVYVGATAVGGFIAGKKMQKKKFAWGLLVGALYFILLFFLSLLRGPAEIEWGRPFLTALFLCLAGGTLGGMLG